MGRLIVFILLLAGGLAQADDEDEVDYQQATRLVEQGEILPLEQVLALVQAAYPGELLEVELEQKKACPERAQGPCYVYEIELLIPQGRVLEIVLDAASGVFIEVEEEDD